MNNLIPILAFLESLSCAPTENIVFVENQKQIAYYQYSDNTVYIRSGIETTTNFNEVLVHELYHSCQKQPTNEQEHKENESRAREIQLRYRNRF